MHCTITQNYDIILYLSKIIHKYFISELVELNSLTKATLLRRPLKQ